MEEEDSLNLSDLSPQDDRILMDLSDIVATPIRGPRARRQLEWSSFEEEVVERFLPPPPPLQTTKVLKIKMLNSLKMDFFTSDKKSVTTVTNVLFVSGRYLISFKPNDPNAENAPTSRVPPYIGYFKARAEKGQQQVLDPVLNRLTSRNSKNCVVLHNSKYSPETLEDFAIFKVETLLTIAIEKHLFGKRDKEITFTNVKTHTNVEIDITIYFETTRGPSVIIKEVKLLVPFEFGNCSACHNFAGFTCQCCGKPVCGAECQEFLNHSQ